MGGTGTHPNDKITGFSHGKKSADKAMLDAWLKEAYMHTELGDKKRALQLYSQVLTAAI